MEKEKENELKEMLNAISCPDNAEDLMTYAIWKYHDLAKKKEIADTGFFYGSVSTSEARRKAKRIMARERWKWMITTISLAVVLNLILNIFISNFLY